MPGAGDLEENKIFKDIALGSGGKDGKSRVSSRQNYRDCPLWANLEKKKMEKEATRKTADAVEAMVYEDVYGEKKKSNTVNK